MSRMFCLVALLLALATPSWAAPTVQVFGGRTTVELSDDFLGALTALQVEAATVPPARQRGVRVSFPIPGGALDLGTGEGDVFHLGGLTLSAGGTRVGLLNFIIDTTGDPELTGLVTVDGTVFGRIKLFDLDLSDATTDVRRRRLSIERVGVTLSQEAADALNLVFGIDDFTAGLDVGEADLETRLRAPRFNLDDDDSDSDDEDSDSR